MNPFGCPPAWLPWVMGGLVGFLLGVVSGYAFGGRVHIQRINQHSQTGGSDGLL